MIMTPSSFTYEQLSGLKFKELQKLSVQFRVNKRWAKKQELIENLLALNDKNDKKQEDEQEWRDASTVFSDLKLNNDNGTNKRLTYNLDRKSSTESDPHLTFEVAQNGKNLLGETGYSRETYDIPPNKDDFGVEHLKESRATFEVPPKKKLTCEVDSRATFEVCKNGEKLLEENLDEVCKKNTEVKCSGLKVKKFDAKSKNKKQENEERKKAEVKMLTIPYARVTRRIRAGEASKNDISPIKMSKKSINIKKSTRIPVSKPELMKSPAFSSVKKPISNQTIIQSFTKAQSGGTVPSKLPIRLQFTEEKTNPSDDKENMRKILRKTGAEGVKKQAKVNFKTPPPSVTKNSRVVALKKTPLRKDPDGASTPGNKSVTKPITATKMPDFSKIHKKQFEQMDSLHDYLKKKEDRIRKLFGTPQPGQQLHNLNKSAPVFHFQSAAEKEKRNENLKSIPTTPLKKKENDPKFQKDGFKSKLRGHQSKYAVSLAAKGLTGDNVCNKFNIMHSIISELTSKTKTEVTYMVLEQTNDLNFK